MPSLVPPKATAQRTYCDVAALLRFSTVLPWHPRLTSREWSSRRRWPSREDVTPGSESGPPLPGRFPTGRVLLPPLAPALLSPWTYHSVQCGKSTLSGMRAGPASQVLSVPGPWASQVWGCQTRGNSLCEAAPAARSSLGGPRRLAVLQAG